MIPLSLIEQFASSSPDRAAIVAGEETLSWQEYRCRVQVAADLLAERLREHPQPRAVLMGEHSVGYVVAASALATLGVAWIGLDPQADPERTVEQLALVAPQIIISDQQFKPAEPAYALTFDSLSVVQARDGQNLSSWQRPPFLALGFTSGTTGLPKLALRLNPSEQRRMETFVLRYGFDSDDAHLVTVPFWHASGHGWARLFLAVGATVVLAGAATPAAYLDLIEEHRIRTTLMVPPVLRSFVEAAELHPQTDLSSLRFLLTGGRQLAPRLFRRSMARLGPVLSTYYGTTETGVNLVADAPTLEASPLSSGLPLPGNEVLVLGRDRRPVKRGRSGRVGLASYMAMAAYANQEADTVQYHGVTYLLTADYGYLDAHNRLVLTNRDDGLPDAGSFPAIQIEADLQELGEVRDAAVIRIADSNGVPQVHAAIVLMPDEDVELARKRARYVVEHWLGDDVSHALSVLEAIPYSRTGKVDLGALRAAACTSEAPTRPVSARAPRRPCLCCSITTS